VLLESALLLRRCHDHNAATFVWFPLWYVPGRFPNMAQALSTSRLRSSTAEQYSSALKVATATDVQLTTCVLLFVAAAADPFG